MRVYYLRRLAGLGPGDSHIGTFHPERGPSYPNKPGGGDPQHMPVTRAKGSGNWCNRGQVIEEKEIRKRQGCTECY